MAKEDKTDVARRGDWKTLDMPEQHKVFVLERHFGKDELEALRRGNIPQAREDKWFWYTEGSTLYAHRSWTGVCIYQIDLKEDGRHVVTVNDDPEQYVSADTEGETAVPNRLLDWWTQAPYDYYNEWLSETYDALKRSGRA